LGRHDGGGHHHHAAADDRLLRRPALDGARPHLGSGCRCVMARISIRGVEKRFGAVPVLSDCTLDIADHEFVVLVGPSGSGKTTLLRIIAGLETASAGELYFDETLVNDVDVADR